MNITLTMINEKAELPTKLVVVCGADSTFATGDMLVDVEGEDPDMTDGSCIASILHGQRGLSIILDKVNAKIITYLA